MTKAEASPALPCVVLRRAAPVRGGPACSPGSGVRRAAYSFQGELAERQPAVAMPPRGDTVRARVFLIKLGLLVSEEEGAAWGLDGAGRGSRVRLPSGFGGSIFQS